jgi:OmpA-OmpF porin, OOP family
MRSAIFASLLVISSISGIGPSAAQEKAPSADDIVKHFQDTADLGSKRGICVGTADECSKDQPAPTGLDMMINFNLDSADLTTQARQNLDEFAKALKDDRLKAATFVVEGYTDASGDEVYNKDLSARRAESVTAFLLANGISRDKVEAIGKGELDPRAPDPYDPVNRRVEMKIKVQ